MVRRTRERGWNGPWSGSYVTTMEGSLRVPFIIRWLGKISAGSVSNEIVREVDMYTTLALIGSAEIPTDRSITDLTRQLLCWVSRSIRHVNGYRYFWEPIFMR